MAEPLDQIEVLRDSIIELATIIKVATATLPSHLDIAPRCNKVIAKVEHLDPVSHAALSDGTGHCIICHKAVQVSVTHIWPLRD